MFHHHGGFQLSLPMLPDGIALTKEQYPALLKILLRSLLNIYNGEQKRVQDGGSEMVPKLIHEFTAYAYNKEPFRSNHWTRETKPLKWWSRLAHDSNARLLSVCYLSIESRLKVNTVTSALQSKFSPSHRLRFAMSALLHGLDGSTQPDEVL